MTRWNVLALCATAILAASAPPAAAELVIVSNDQNPLAALRVAGAGNAGGRALDNAVAPIRYGDAEPTLTKAEASADGGGRAEYALAEGVRGVVTVAAAGPGVYDLSCEVFTAAPQRLVDLDFPRLRVPLRDGDELFTFSQYKYKKAFFDRPDAKTGGQTFGYLSLGEGAGLAAYVVWPAFDHTPESVKAPVGFRAEAGPAPGTLDARFGWKAYTWKPAGEAGGQHVWRSPVVRLRGAADVDAALALFAADNPPGPTYAEKLARYPDADDRLKTHLFLKWNGYDKGGDIGFEQLTDALDLMQLDSEPLPLMLHLVSTGEGFDHRYPEFLPVPKEKGGRDALERLYRVAHERGMLVGPYTNVTWWGDASPFDDKANKPTKANRSRMLEEWSRRWDAAGTPYAGMARDDAPRDNMGSGKTDKYAEWYPNTEKGKLRAFGWRMSQWHPAVLAEAEALYKQFTGGDDAFGHYESDYLFLDQIAARGFGGPFGDYDFNNDAGIMDRYTPYGMQDGLDNLARLAAEHAPVAIEGHSLKVMPHAWLFCSSSSLKNVVDEARKGGLSDAGQEFVATQARYYRKYVSMSGHNLMESNLPVGDHAALGAHLALGYRLHVSAQPHMAKIADRPEFVDWVQYCAMLQKHVCSRYEGVEMSVPQRGDGGLWTVDFGGLRVTWNPSDEPARLDDSTVLAPWGFDAADAADGLRAGCYDAFDGLSRAAGAPPIRAIVGPKAGVRLVWTDAAPGTDQAAAPPAEAR